VFVVLTVVAMKKTLLGFLALTCFAICGIEALDKASAANTAGPILFGPDSETTFWRLTSIEGTPAISEDTVVEISIQTLFLSVPCYVSGFAYVFDNNGLDIRNRYHYGSTCAGYPQPSTVAAYEATLSKAKTYRLSGDDLALLDGTGKVVITLTRLVATGIENRRWSIEAFFDGTSLISIADKLRADPFRAVPLSSLAQFDIYRAQIPDLTLVHGRVYGTPGCGGFVSEYSLAGDRLNLDPAALLTGYCPELGREIERGISTALRGDRIIRQVGDRMHLVDRDGRLQIVLAPWHR
jgi:heat shock protein HslJ